MGYSTSFEGVVKFAREITTAELRIIQEILEQDDAGKLAEASGYPRTKDDDFSWIALEINKDFTGLVWNGGEKTYFMITSLNVVMHAIKQQIPDLEFEGSMMAQGESIGDIWRIEVKGSFARQTEVLKPAMTKCPHCREWFKTADAESKGGETP